MTTHTYTPKPSPGVPATDAAHVAPNIIRLIDAIVAINRLIEIYSADGAGSAILTHGEVDGSTTHHHISHQHMLKALVGQRDEYYETLSILDAQLIPPGGDRDS